MSSPQSFAWPPRAWAAAVIAVLVVAGGLSLPFYHPRVTHAWNQMSLLPRRVQASKHDLHLALQKRPYEVAVRVLDSTFPDAVILVPDTVEDDPLHRVGWLAWFLYPRVLVQQSNLAVDPSIVVDFALVTDHFHAGLPESEKQPGIGLFPLSDRARRHFEERSR